MELISNKVNKAEIRLIVKLSPQDYRGKLTAKIKMYAQNAHIPGFRPGNTAIIRQRYGNKIAIEVIEDMLGETLKNYVKEHNLTLLADPIFYFNDELHQKILQSQPVDVDLLLELIPNFKVELDEGIQVEKYELTEVKQVDLEAYLNQLRYKHSSMVVAEEVIEGDVLHLGWLTSDNQERVFAIPLNPDDVAVVPKWIGCKVGDELAVSYDKLLKIADIVPQELRETAQPKAEIKLKLINIKRIIVPELNDSLRKTLLQDDGADPEEDFHTHFAEKMHQELVYRLDELTKNQIKEQLLSRTAIDVPENYSEQEQDDLRFMFILEKIAENASINVPEPNTDLILLTVLNQTLTRALGKPPKEKELLAYFRVMYPPKTKEKYKNKLRLHDLTLEVLPYIKKHISVTKKTVSSTEAQTLLAKNNLNGRSS